MTDDRLDRLDYFKAFIKEIEDGAPVPPVSRYDLRHLHLMSEYMLKEHPTNEGDVSIDLVASVCGPEANLPAVWFRHAQLKLLLKQGVLAEWQHGTELDDAVYEVAATISMNGLQFDHEAFIQRLQEESRS